MSNETTRVRALRASLMAALVAFACACTLAFVAPQSAWAASNVAKIGDTEYATLQAAVDAIAENGTGTITLLSNIDKTGVDGESGDGTLLINKKGVNITIDLGGYTLTANPGEGNDVISVKSAENVTLTVKNGTLINEATAGYGLYVYKYCSNFSGTFDNVTFKASDQVLGVQGLNSNQNLTVKDSTIDAGTTGLGIYFPPKSGTLTLSGNTTVSGHTGIVVKGGTLKVADDTVTVNGCGTEVVPTEYYDGNPSKSLTLTGDAVYVESGYTDRNISVEISNGTFKSINAQGIRYFKKADTTLADGVTQKVAVSGGTFSQPVPDSCIDGELVNLTSDGDTFTLGSSENAVAKVTLPTQAESTDAVSAIYFTTKEAAEDYVKDNKNTTVTYLKYTLTFVSQGGSAVESQVLNAAVSGQTAGTTTKPADPTREGYAFKGWYTDKACTDGNEFTFGKELTEDTTVYAKWAQTHTVTFIVSTGGDTLTQTVEHGLTATQPTDPTLDGYTFVGWFADSAFTTAYDFSTPVTADTTIYGGWQENASSSDGSADESTATAKSSSAKTGDASGAAAAALAGLALCSAGAIALARRKQD